MDFKPNAILDSMDRAQALACVLKRHRTAHSHDFVYGGIVYSCPVEIGLHECASCVPECGSQWIRAINAYYDAKDAASKKWVEPQSLTWRQYSDQTEKIFGDSRSWVSEIARTNARRKITSTIDANGGSGVYALAYDAINGEFYVEKLDNTVLYAGEIRCVSRELAQHIIETLRDELLLVVGVKS